MADSEKNSEPSPSTAGESCESGTRNRFFTAESIPRLSYSDPRANELISNEVYSYSVPYCDIVIGFFPPICMPNVRCLYDSDLWF